jgi:hypothetical protein
VLGFIVFIHFAYSASFLGSIFPCLFVCWFVCLLCFVNWCVLHPVLVLLCADPICRIFTCSSLRIAYLRDDVRSTAPTSLYVSAAAAAAPSSSSSSSSSALDSLELFYAALPTNAGTRHHLQHGARSINGGYVDVASLPHRT